MDNQLLAGDLNSLESLSADELETFVREFEFNSKFCDGQNEDDGGDEDKDEDALKLTSLQSLSPTDCLEFVQNFTFEPNNNDGRKIDDMDPYANNNTRDNRLSSPNTQQIAGQSSGASKSQQNNRDRFWINDKIRKRFAEMHYYAWMKYKYKQHARPTTTSVSILKADEEATIDINDKETLDNIVDSTRVRQTENRDANKVTISTLLECKYRDDILVYTLSNFNPSSIEHAEHRTIYNLRITRKETTSVVHVQKHTERLRKVQPPDTDTDERTRGGHQEKTFRLRKLKD
ncbi:uncharacterized protein L201_007683 [Kwoniella dendrophila CBS 6074]|uniref:ASX DEUBAD domain-containing protein n=1 Tax=Kwoniella dendrophila CBS 6074 TaxID=1295534 RepID=A0AAX4K6G7_9TREE